MFGSLGYLTKAVVGVVIETPIALAADALTLGGAITEKDEPYTATALKGVMQNIENATKPEKKMTTITFHNLTDLPPIKPDCFLVLHGKQGAGKSEFARRIALTRGRFSEISVRELADKAALSDALANAPSTLIIEVDSLRPKDSEILKIFVTSPSVRIRRPNSPLHMVVQMPLIIVVTQNPDQFIGTRRGQLFCVGKD